VPFSVLISPPPAAFPPTFDPPQQAMVLRPLFPWDPELGLAYCSLLLATGAVRVSPPRTASVVDPVVVLQGRLAMCTGGVWQTIDAGKGLRFAGDTAHTYRNSSDQTVQFHSLI
ncbi:cupin domain-containing protein, partial [Salmonella enterica subsp. enterica serovar Oslo]